MCFTVASRFVGLRWFLASRFSPYSTRFAVLISALLLPLLALEVTFAIHVE